MTMNINLTPKLESMVREKVSSGRYTSASEVVREALRLMEEQDHLRAAKLEQLRQSIQEGVASGAASPLDMAEVQAEARRRRAQRQAAPETRD
jgi:antitoxin ParD1/3/4